MATLKNLLETALLKVGGVGTMPSTNSADLINVVTTTEAKDYTAYIAPSDGWLNLVCSVPTSANAKLRLLGSVQGLDSYGATTFMPASSGATGISIPAKKGSTVYSYWSSGMGYARVSFIKSVGGAL